ncbi:unnamed protein product [Cunninghamella blakesleeana]
MNQSKKMMNHVISYIAVFSLLFNYISCVSLPPAYKLGCVALANKKIYCYGGATKPPGSTYASVYNDQKLYNDLYSLDVSQPLNMNSSNTNWQLIPAPSDFAQEARADFAMVAFNDTGFIISSGNGPSTDFSNPGLVNVTVKYNTETSSWKAVKSLNPLAPKMNISLDTQTFGSRAVKYNDTGIFFSGGNSPNNNTIIQADTQLVTYEAESPDWATVMVTTIVIKPGPFITPLTSRIFHHALATSRNGFVYFFGGAIPQNNTNNFGYQDNLGLYTFKSLLTFAPPVNNSFKITDCSNSQQIPEGRQMHTATPIPNTDNILIYGGRNDQGALPDFCWIFQVTDKVYQQCKITNQGSGPRYGHAAVMVGADSLYIIGGADVSDNQQGDVHILNVTSMTWINGSYTNTVDQDAAASQNSGSTALSAGAIAGAVIGSVAGVAIIIAGAVFFYLSRKKKKMYEAGDAPQGFNTDITPVMVDVKNDHDIYSETKTEVTSPTAVGSVHTFKPDLGNYENVSTSATSEKPNMY